jgi:hypothetical protein
LNSDEQFLKIKVMDLQKTTIIPTDNAKISKSLLNNLISEEGVVLFIVIGSNQLAENLVQMADTVARTRPEIRRVVWINMLNPVIDIIEPLIDNYNSSSEIITDPAFAIVLSLAGKVCDVIPYNEPKLNFVRINDAFLKAEIGIES